MHLDRRRNASGPSRSLKELYAKRESEIIQSETIRAVTVVVDLADSNSHVLTCHDIKPTAELSRPTVIGPADSMYVTAAEQSMHERFELAVVGPLGKAGPDQIGKGAAGDSIDILTGEGQVAFNGPPFPKVDGRRHGYAEQILAAYRSLKSIESDPYHQITFWVILAKTCTPTQKQKA